MTSDAVRASAGKPTSAREATEAPVMRVVKSAARLPTLASCSELQSVYTSIFRRDGMPETQAGHKPAAGTG